MGDLLPCPFCGGPAEVRGDTSTTVQCLNDQCIIGDPAPFNDFSHRYDAIAAWNTRLASQAVVSQDLVPVAWMYVHPEFGVQVFTGRYDRPSGGTPDDFLGWAEEPLYPASAIEAAQIAARNEALEGRDEIDWYRILKAAGRKNIDKARAVVTALRTPSQHQQDNTYE